MDPESEEIEKCLAAVYKTRVDGSADSEDITARLGWSSSETENF